MESTVTIQLKGSLDSGELSNRKDRLVAMLESNDFVCQVEEEWDETTFGGDYFKGYKISANEKNKI